MISHTHKFIFFHIPKAGGTSVEMALYPYASESRGTQWAIRHRCWRNKLLFEFAREHPDYCSFSFCRDPRQRFVSAWNQFRRFEDEIDVEGFLRLTEDFLQQDPARFYRELPVNHTRINSMNSSICPEFDEFHYPYQNTNTGYHLLPQHYFLQTGIDFIGRMESFRRDFRFITGRILGQPIKLPHANRGARMAYTDTLNRAQIQRIEKLYAEDLVRFGYSPDN